MFLSSTAVDDLPLAENDLLSLAQSLAVRLPDEAQDIVEGERGAGLGAQGVGEGREDGLDPGGELGGGDVLLHPAVGILHLRAVEVVDDFDGLRGRILEALSRRLLGAAAARAGGDEEGEVARIGRLSDLIVTSRPHESQNAPYVVLLETALFETGRPVLVAAAETPSSIGERVVVVGGAAIRRASLLASRESRWRAKSSRPRIGLSNLLRKPKCLHSTTSASCYEF